MTSRHPQFDPTRFDPARTTLPSLAPVSTPDESWDLVIGLIEGSQGTIVVGNVPGVDDLSSDLAALGASAKAGCARVVLVGSRRVVCVGLGTNLDLSAEELRIGAGVGVRTLIDLDGQDSIRVAIDFSTDAGEQIYAIGEGALLACDTFAKLGHDRIQPVAEIQVVTGAKDADQICVQAAACAQAICVARDWTNMPPNLLAPSDLTDQAKGFVADSSISVEVLNEKDLAKGGYGGILAVGGGSVRPPRLLRLDYNPKSAKRHLVLVGKGITYDSGGYNLKPGDSLITMKHDMAGAAAVIAAIKVIADRGLPIHVTCYAPIAEQMISGSAYRPSDVITMLDGTTVENMNSDCEGRMVLADALVRASREQPDLIVDIATLTGACVVALGETYGGLMTNNDATADRVLDAAVAAGESWWQLPITDEVRSQLSSPVADLQSKGPGRFGGTLFAAAFLESFVADGIDWAHLDVAGPAWNRHSAHDYVPHHSTGFGIRTMIQIAEQMALRS